MNNPRPGKNSRFPRVLLFPLLLLALPAMVRAQDADPPSRVARLNLVEGSVSFQPAGTSDWIESNPNRPLTTGDQLWADQGSRGELHMGGSVLRIAAQTGISFLNLGDQAVQIQVAQGSAVLRVLRLQDNENYEIDTPNLALTVLRPGEFRLDVSADGTSTFVTILGGSGEVTSGGAAYPVSPGQQYSFSGTDQVNYYAQPVPGSDDFQNWNIQRDRREDRMTSDRYVSRDVIGYEDLDDHGDWRDDPEYGHVWYPRGVEAGWAPYHNGHWAFVAPWGWTWVEDEPWGFAPFHYGRWAVVRGAWGWVPGPPAVEGAVYVRPVYAPALVAFVGGGGFAASITIGGGAGVAWFPLGPRDVWAPSYHVSPRYMNDVNVTNSRVVNKTEITNVYNTTVINNNNTTVNSNTTNITKVNENRTYMYQNTAGAVTAVPKASFQNGEPVAKAAVQVNTQQIQHPQVVQTAAIAPSPRAVAGPAAPAKVSARPPATLVSRPVVTKMAPPPTAIPIGHSAPPAPSTYHSMAGAKPAPTPTPGSVANGPAPGTPGKPPVAGPPPGQPGAGTPPAGKPMQPAMRTNEPTANPPGKFQPPANANQPTANPPAKFQPPTRENQPPSNPNQPTTNPPAKFQPPRGNQPPANPNQPTANPPAKFQPPTRESQPPANPNQPATNPPAKFQPPPRGNQPPANPNPPTTNPPAKFQPPTRESQPPANPNQPPANPPAKFQPPTRENLPPARGNEPPANPPAPPARTNPPPANPPPARKPGPPPNESKPTNDSKDKEKDKER